MKHTSSFKYNIVLAGVQLVLQEASDKLNDFRRQGFGRNFCSFENDIRIQIEMIKEAVKFLESQLDNHITPYQYEKRTTRFKQIPSLDFCPECQDPKCSGFCDRKDEEE